MAPISLNGPSHLVNPLVTSQQLETSASQLDGCPADLEDSIRYESSRLLQAAGILLRLPQEIIAQSIVILQRCLAGADGRSILEIDPKDVAAASLYVVAKPSAHSVSPKQLLTVVQYLSSVAPDYSNQDAHINTLEAQSWLSDGQYETRRNTLYAIEAQILRTLGFQTHVVVPYTLCVNYLQTLEAFHSSEGSLVAKRAFAHLNTALLSPQQLYLTHQPAAIATAAIYLAARDVGMKMPEVDWWEVFDVDREELGFLVLALRSIESFALDERRKWGKRKVPVTALDVQSELERRRMLTEGQ